jgi:hypothetical protein
VGSNLAEGVAVFIKNFGLFCGAEMASRKGAKHAKNGLIAGATREFDRLADKGA